MCVPNGKVKQNFCSSDTEIQPDSFRKKKKNNTVIINIMVYKKSPNQQKMAKSTIFIISKVFLVQSFTENT